MSPNSIFVALVISAMVLRRTSFLYPLKWLEVYFHELSHGLAAVATLGRIHRIKLSLNGAGQCSTQGGFRFIILLSGYLGAIFWGMTIYIAGLYLSESDAFNVLYVLLFLLGFSTLMWVRDGQTLFIMLSMAGFFLLPVFFFEYPVFGLLLQFVGLYILLSAIGAPLILIDGKHEGDGAELANLTYIPEGVWIMLWFALGVLVLFFLWMLNVPNALEALLPMLV